jgi:hypothetical protein
MSANDCVVLGFFAWWGIVALAILFWLGYQAGASRAHEHGGSQRNEEKESDQVR